MKISIIRNLLFAISILCFISCSNEINRDPYPNFSFPIIDGAYDITTTWENDIFSKQTIYSISKSIEPDKIFEFYSSQLLSKTFESNVEAMFFTEPTEGKKYISDGNWLEPPAQYFMGWLNKDNTMVLKVTAFYKTAEQTQITCFLHPYSDQTDFVLFKEEMEKTGKIDEMIEFAQRFKKENGNFDVERAKMNVKNNVMLKRFIEIVENDTENLKANYSKYNENN
jgi:hypothetical protein